jgi:hypothetical protein
MGTVSTKMPVQKKDLLARKMEKASLTCDVPMP